MQHLTLQTMMFYCINYWYLWNSTWLNFIILVWLFTVNTVQETSVGRVAAAVWCLYTVSALYGSTVWHQAVYDALGLPVLWQLGPALGAREAIRRQSFVVQIISVWPNPDLPRQRHLIRPTTSQLLHSTRLLSQTGWVHRLHGRRVRRAQSSLRPVCVYWIIAKQLDSR